MDDISEDKSKDGNDNSASNSEVLYWTTAASSILEGFLISTVGPNTRSSS